ncbi:MAG: TonB-dependent receptor plug domain-containing protein [Steroidobacterales bacterium]
MHTLLYFSYAASASMSMITDARAHDPVANFNLPSEPLPQALIDFYHQSGIEPGFASTPQIDKAKSNPVTGEMASSMALAQLLKGTGYTFRRDTENSVDVIPNQANGEQKPTVAGARRPVPPVAAGSAVGQNKGRLEQVNVTGSLIHGVQDAVAPLIYLKRQQLQMASFPTIQDALYSLPMMSLNGPREDLGIDNNYQYGAGLDLRGLGVGATLVLVNGYRQPLSGLNGDFVDVSTIPWSAVQRIEVLPDGASALYGSDAVAGVVNIIMRDNFDGAETQVRYGSAISGPRGLMASQLLGTHWSGGHAMLAYEYSDTTPLAAADRPYAANANKTPYGGNNYDSYESDPGNILNPATLQPEYGVPAGQNGTGLSAAVLERSINLQNQFAQYQIFPEVRAHELYTAAAQDINDRVQLFFNGRFAGRDTLRSAFPAAQVLTVPPSNPFYVNPYRGAPYALVAYSFLQDLGPSIFAARTQVYAGTAGAKLQFGKTWQLTASESYGRQSLRSDEYNQVNQTALTASLADPDPATAFDPFGAGSNTNPQTLQAIEADFPLHSVTTIEATRVAADGSLFAMPAGDAKIALGLERREEALSHDVVDTLSALQHTLSESYDRHVTALFSQLALPVIGDPANPRATPRLELIASGRYERYNDFGRTFNPTVRVRWIPTESLKLRASWGRSFRAPKLDDLYDTSNDLAASIVLSDPKSPTGRSLVLVEEGSNPGLKEETAKTWTAGFDLAPVLLPGSTFSFTYYSIDYQNRIAQPAADDPFAILVNENEWAAVITRNPFPAQVAALCNGPHYVGLVSACLASSPAAIIDGRLANLAATRTTGMDVQAGDSFGGPWGRIDLGVTGNYVFKFDQAVTPTSSAVDIVNTITNPLALRLRGTVEWDREGPAMPGPGFSLAVNYTGGYKNPGSTLIANVSPWTTLDARFAFRTRQGEGWLSGLELSVSAVNVLNHAPPFVDDLSGYDIYNVQALGRVIAADIDKRW